MKTLIYVLLTGWMLWAPATVIGGLLGALLALWLGLNLLGWAACGALFAAALSAVLLWFLLSMASPQ